MSISNENSVNVQNIKNHIEHLIRKFYELRSTFEADYSGKLRSDKYEEARDFTITLNNAIFQANQLFLKEANFKKSFSELSCKLEAIKQDYLTLTE